MRLPLGAPANTMCVDINIWKSLRFGKSSKEGRAHPRSCCNPRRTSCLLMQISAHGTPTDTRSYFIALCVHCAPGIAPLLRNPPPSRSITSPPVFQYHPPPPVRTSPLSIPGIPFNLLSDTLHKSADTCAAPCAYDTSLSFASEGTF